MSHEFKLQYYVNQLMGSLQINDIPDGPGAEVLTSILQYNPASNQITQASAAGGKKKMAELADDSDAFVNKYDDLKSKNVKDVDALVSLMVKIKKDSQIQALLAHSPSSSTNNNTSNNQPLSTDILAQGDAAITAIINTAIDTAVNTAVDNVAATDSDQLSVTEVEKIKNELSKMAATQTTLIERVPNKQKNKNQARTTLKMPLWLSQRPTLTMDFSSDHVSDPHKPSLSGMHIQQQEELIITDLLFCLEGISGRYIEAEPLLHKHALRSFTIDPSLDSSLKELVLRVLPLCSHYSTVTRFIEDQYDFHNGLVKQALAASFRTIINDYMILMTQLEGQQKKGKLSLQKLWFYIQSPLHTFTVLQSIIASINQGKLRGGSVLSLLHDKIPSYLGNPKAQQLCLHVTKSASLPYFQILEKWIYKGIILDLYDEFLIEEDEAFKKEKLAQDFNDAYWEQKYTVKQANTPCFLDAVAVKVLNTGKYLNVIRQCGRDVSSPCTEAIEYSGEMRDYVERIEANFQWSSSLLLDLLMKEMDLMTRLRSLKHYFMLDQGDFIVQFMDLAENELKKPMDDILLPRLDTLLEIALRTSAANVDPYKDDLKVDLLPYDLITQLFKILSIETKKEKDYHRLEATDLHLSGLESFSFDYVVRWPVSLVLNRKALTRYQMLSRHLFYSKHVERQLCNIWLKDKGAKGWCNGGVGSLRAKAYALRQRMLNFVQNLEYYAMYEVIEPLWQQFERDMANVCNVDEVLMLHSDMLNNCMKHCMLTNPKLLRTLHKLMIICVTFCNFMQKSSGHLSSKDDSQEDSESRKNTKANAASSSSTPDESHERTLSNFDHNFCKHLVELLNKIVEFSAANSEQGLLTFVHRLDYNGFYKKEMDKLTASRMNASSRSSSSQRASTSSNKALRI